MLGAEGARILVKKYLLRIHNGMKGLFNFVTGAEQSGEVKVVGGVSAAVRAGPVPLSVLFAIPVIGRYSMYRGILIAFRINLSGCTER